MKKTFFVFIFIGLFAFMGFSDSNSKKMIKIIMRDTSPDVAPTSFAAKPKTIYRIGDQFGRNEEMPDTENKIHQLMIVAEPKVWIINLMDKTGQLVLDPGPTFIFRAPILPLIEEDQEPPLKDFEFGREYEFLRSHKAAKSTETIQGKTYDKLSLSTEGFELSLLSYKGEDRPFRVNVRKGKLIFSQFDYDEYKTDLEPDMKLFRPPDDIKISGQEPEKETKKI